VPESHGNSRGPGPYIVRVAPAPAHLDLTPMDLRQIGTLYMHEVRSALRERTIVVGSIVVPLVMYPALLWAAFAGISFVGGQADRLTSRVAIQGLPEIHRAFADSLEGNGRISLTEWEGHRESAQAAIARGRLDVHVEFSAAGAAGEALEDNLQVRVSYNEARDRSRGARARVEAALDDYRQGWVDEARRDLGVPDPVWADFAVTRSDVATAEETSRFILAMVVPFLTLITVALAAFYPAIDATAGERERSTWETLMTVAAPRGNVAAAKYLYVATFGAMGGLLNLTALALSLRWILEPLAGGDTQELARGGIPLEALPVIALGTALLGLFVAAGMLVFAIFARNFKEGQSMITPFYMVVILPAIFVQSPDIEFTPTLAAVPIVNVAMLIREAILGTVPALPGVITLLTMAACVAVSVSFAQWVMRREEVLLGSGEGGLWVFLKRQLRNGGKTA
jgi:sodium transport system permease protein